MKLKEYLETRKIKNNILKVMFLTVFVLSLNSLSYAYFTSSIEGEGRALIGVDEEDTTIASSGLSGGEKEVTLTTANLPTHTHTIPGLTGTATSTNSAHYHNLNGTNAQAVTKSLTGSLKPFAYYSAGSSGVFTTTSIMKNVSLLGEGTTYGTHSISFNATHNHSLSGYTASDGAHSHSVTTTPSATGSEGEAQKVNNLQPYITVYMWKRTA